jgi:transposase
MGMAPERRYPSDLSDARWELIESTLAAWRDRRRAGALDIGRPPEHDLRTIMDAIVYVDRTGIPWRYLPHDYPPFLWNQICQLPARLPCLTSTIGKRVAVAGTPI